MQTFAVRRNLMYNKMMEKQESSLMLLGGGWLPSRAISIYLFTPVAMPIKI